jgi:DNA-binding winged helix-turn-helix (wHTH) protein/Tol biopolymer transport system component
MPATEAPIATDRQRLPSLSFGAFEFDAQTRLLCRDGREVALPPRVLGVLEILLSRAGDVVSRQELIDTVWKDAFVTDTSLAEAVSVLRQSLGDDSQSPTYIQTLHRRGYRFVAPVSTADAAPVQQAVAREDTPAAEPAISPSIGGHLLPWSAAVICAIIAGAAVWQATRDRQAASAPAARFAVTPAPGTRFDTSAPALALSADSTQLAWSGCDDSGCRLYIRPLDRLEPSALAGTDDGHAPFFSPDGRWIAFFADGRLKKVAVAGGAPVTLADAPAVFGGVWIDREIVFAGSPSGGLMRVASDGGEPRTITTPREANGEVRHAWPALVPNERALLFTIDTMAVDGAPGTIGTLPLDSGSSEAKSWGTLMGGVGLARAAARDTIVFARGPELDAIAFDPVRMATAGTPRAVVGPIATAQGLAQYAVSSTGSIVWAVAPVPPSLLPFELGWWSPSGFQSAADEIRRLRGATLSPDGTRVAGVIVEGSRADVWLADVDRGTATRLTHTGINASPIWATDGRTVYYASRSDGVFSIWSRDSDGTRPATRLAAIDGSRHAFPVAVSSDGAMLAFLQTASGRRTDLWVLPLRGGPPRVIVSGPFDDSAASFSPDSRLVAFQSAETGRWEICLQNLNDGRRIVVSTDGGERPFWTKDGLYFQSRGQLMRARIAAGDTMRVEGVTRIGDLEGGTLQGASPDGRILVQSNVQQTAGSSPGAAVVSLEWLREVRALLGPPATALPR